MYSISGYGERLRDELGEPGEVRPLGSSPRSKVWWTRLRGGPAIVKQIVGGADAAQRFQREVDALRLAGAAAPPVVPAVLGTEPSARLFVLEYLDEGRRGEGWQLDYAAALARLHACGAGAPSAAALPRWQGPDEADVDDFLALAAAWGAADDGAAREELTALLRRLGRTETVALLHGDPCPAGNVLYSPHGLRFIDLEQASLGDGLVELAYLRIGFPTCYSSPDPAPLLAEAEAAYRESRLAATGIPVSGGLADACAGWTISGDSLVERAHRRGRRHLRELVDTDWAWGKATARERVAFRLESTAAIAAGTAELGAVGELCHRLRTAMRSRWPRLRRLTAPELNYP